MKRLGLVIAVTGLIGCAHRSPTGVVQPRAAAESATEVGFCMEAKPLGTLTEADRDLDGDGSPEWVRNSPAQCDDRGNCVWTVATDDAGCMRIVGAIVGRAIELLPSPTPGLQPLRAVFALGADRLLLTRYVYTARGYEPTETLLCRRQGATRVACIPH